MYPLICSDCRWYIPDDSCDTFSKCRAAEAINLVNGERTYQYCITERMSAGNCQPEGKLFSLNIPDEIPNDPALEI